MTYTIKLIALECFAAGEVDGDEIYIKLDAAKVWETTPDKMSARPESDEWVSHYDFVGGRKLTSLGWTPLASYNPETFVFRDQSGDSVLQLWDVDILTRNELLGQTPIDASKAKSGSISVVFKHIGAHYALTYKVEDQG